MSDEEMQEEAMSDVELILRKEIDNLQDKISQHKDRARDQQQAIEELKDRLAEANGEARECSERYRDLCVRLVEKGKL